MTGHVDELLRRMTLSEKVGQLVVESPFAPVDWVEVERQRKQADERGLPYEPPLRLSETIEDQVRSGRVGAIVSGDRQTNVYLQKLARRDSRLGIPLLIGLDVLHGLRTVFPIPLASACSWNPALVERAARAAALEASSVGINWVFAPMVDVARDCRWGRIAEGAGEDPFLGRAMAQAQVKGFQSSDLPSGLRVAACPKHFVGYGAAEGGRDYNTVDISERTLREVYLPPFKAALDCGAGSIMSAFHELSGVPVTSHPRLLRGVLRDEWGWSGPVVSDFNAIAELVEHGVAKDVKDAARRAILAGVDMDLGSGAYAAYLEQLVEEGSVPLEVIDEAVRRVLSLKAQLGLFECALVDEQRSSDLCQTHVLTSDHLELARELAAQSIVLLKNDKELLPLPNQGVRVALIGPFADNRADLLGTWSPAGQACDVVTLRKALEERLAPGDLMTQQGCSLDGNEDLDFSQAIDAARKADVVIVALGEGANLSGEASSRAHLGLPGRQEELVASLASTGCPLVAVLFCGRPLVVSRLAEQVDALLVAWHGGVQVGEAVADVLLGASNPSGKLCACWPRCEGQIPVYYAHKPTGRPAEGPGTVQTDAPLRTGYIDESTKPLYSFGYGLSYSAFAYSEVRVLTPVVSADGHLRVAVKVKNTSAREGEEVVQLYVRDAVSSITRPVKELKGFQRVRLKAGEEQQVLFEVPAQELGFYDEDMRYVVEPGLFKVWVGPDSASGLVGEFEISQEDGRHV